jgi:predicted nucleotidyltransferase
MLLSTVRLGHVWLASLVEWHWLAILLLHHVRWHWLAISIWVERHWLWSHVLVWVEASKSDDVGKVLDLNHWSHWVEVLWTHILTILSGIVKIVLFGSVVLEFLWHWWQSDSIWKVWKRINESSSLFVVVEEGASFTKLALTSSVEVLARLSLVVGVYSTEGSLAEVLWEWIIALSELVWTMSELAKLLERANAVLHEMLAHLGLVLLLESIELALVSIEVIVITLLGKMAHHLTRRVVEVLLWFAIFVKLTSILVPSRLGARCVFIWRVGVRRFLAVHLLWSLKVREVAIGFLEWNLVVDLLLNWHSVGLNL